MVPPLWADQPLPWPNISDTAVATVGSPDNTWIINELGAASDAFGTEHHAQHHDADRSWSGPFGSGHQVYSGVINGTRFELHETRGHMSVDTITRLYLGEDDGTTWVAYVAPADEFWDTFKSDVPPPPVDVPHDTSDRRTL